MSDRNPDGTFKPGVSGNPSGRPPGSVSLKSLLQERIATLTADGKSYADALIDSTLQAALDGDAQARKLVFEYLEGRPHQSIDLSATGELVTIVDNLPRFTEAEIAEAATRWQCGERPKTAAEAGLWFDFDEYGPRALALVDALEAIETACAPADDPPEPEPQPEPEAEQPQPSRGRRRVSLMHRAND
jgi:hypothetical protein